MASESNPDNLKSRETSQFRPEELPPVTPPSAGFIVQLFLIPALIVMAVVAVWALFGKLADSDNDWKQLATELSSSNEHRRWRAALGLAQLLQNEQIYPPRDQQPLATNPVVVDSLTQLLSESLASTTTTDEDIRHQEFLARTLAALDADEKTLPILAEAMKDSHNIEVRKSSLMSIAAIAGRHFDHVTGYSAAVTAEALAPSMSVRKLPLANPTISDSAVLEQLRRSAQDSDPVVRHLAGYALGNVSGPDSLVQLRVMLTDGNRLAQANAAIGLSRNGSIDGVPTMIQLLTTSLTPFEYQVDPALKDEAAPLVAQQAEARHQIEEVQVARNCLRAIENLWPQIDIENRASLTAIVTQVEQKFPASDVRQQAGELLKTIGQP
ncbi:MAG: HEAT repeat domain-containing protein [Planctomycetota bacterium]|nr:MAG: HEAT repeat domain-containing protein [Planctomycetota bacterium]